MTSDEDDTLFTGRGTGGDDWHLGTFLKPEPKPKTYDPWTRWDELKYRFGPHMSFIILVVALLIGTMILSNCEFK